MITKAPLVSVCLSLLLVTACSNQKRSPELEEAIAIHRQIMHMEKEILLAMDSLQQVVANDSSLASFQVGLVQFEQELKEWDENMVSVGDEESHEHHHHDHQHEQKPELTDEQMRGVQLELKNQLASIRTRLLSFRDSLYAHLK